MFAWLKKRSGKGRAAEAAPSAIDLGLADAERAEILRRSISLLSDLSPDQARDLVHGVAAEYARWVVDLPASENHHHNYRWGLLDHGLETALYALEVAYSRSFVTSAVNYPEKQEFRLPRLRYVTFLMALIHDVGKIMGVQVRCHGEAWNPYDVEPLADFYARVGGHEECTLHWRAGRGLNTHTWHNAYFVQRILTPPAARYLGSALFAEILERESGAAKEVFSIMEDADHRSTREDNVRKANDDYAARAAARSGPSLVGVPDFLEKIPDLVARGIVDGILRPNALDGDLWIGKKHVLLRYPEALVKIVGLLKDAVGRESAEVRGLRASEEGARELGHALHRGNRLIADPETNSWKMKAKLEEGESFDVVGAVLLDRRYFETALRILGAAPLFPGSILLHRFSDGAPVAIDDFHGHARASGEKPGAARPAAPPKTPPPPPASAAAPRTPLAPTGAKPERATGSETGAPIPPPAPGSDLQFKPEAAQPSGPPIEEKAPLPIPRTSIAGDILIEDLRYAITTGWIEVNVWEAPCYALADVTYLVMPRALQILVENGLYANNLKTDLNLFLDALATVPCVRKKPNGKVLVTVRMRPGSRGTFRAVAIETRGLFTTATELAKFGEWTKSPIQELSDEEAKALRSAARADHAPASDASPGDSAHA